MGYRIQQESAVFHVRRENNDSALEKLETFFEDRDGSRVFAWCGLADSSQWRTLQAALKDLRWGCEVNEDGDIVGIEFEGENLGDDAQFFLCIAKFIEPGSFIEVRGEDGARWRLFEKLHEDGNKPNSHLARARVKSAGTA